ncbi:hypothetical protein E2542_SST13044 [Spatholobus suberectus]|nr:hypothetical protein E2542_SST13044 [Spatholobus suberectus]
MREQMNRLWALNILAQLNKLMELNMLGKLEEVYYLREFKSLRELDKLGEMKRVGEWSRLVAVKRLGECNKLVVLKRVKKWSMLVALKRFVEMNNKMELKKGWKLNRLVALERLMDLNKLVAMDNLLDLIRLRMVFRLMDFGLGHVDSQWFDGGAWSSMICTWSWSCIGLILVLLMWLKTMSTSRFSFPHEGSPLFLYAKNHNDTKLLMEVMKLLKRSDLPLQPGTTDIVFRSWKRRKIKKAQLVDKRKSNSTN